MKGTRELTTTGGAPVPDNQRRVSTAARRVLTWLFVPAPFLEAVSVTYRRSFQLAGGLFLGTALLVVLGALLPPGDPPAATRRCAFVLPGMASGFEKAIEAIARSPDEDDHRADPRDVLWDKLLRGVAGSGGERSDVNLSQDELDQLLLPYPPSVSEVLFDTWLGILFLFLGNTFLLVGLGFVVGLYPVGMTVLGGVMAGIPLARLFQGGGGGTLEGCLWLFPVWLMLVLASILSAAIGLDMARYIAQPAKGTWFKVHIRQGLTTWGTAVVPAILTAMLLLGAMFTALVIASGDPAVR